MIFISCVLNAFIVIILRIFDAYNVGVHSKESMGFVPC